MGKKSKNNSRIRSCGFLRILHIKIKDFPAVLEPQAGARNMRNTTVEIGRNLQLQTLLMRKFPS